MAGVDPGTAFIASSIIGTGVSAYGAYTQGQQAKSAANYSAKVAEQEAAIEKRNAEIAVKESQREARSEMRERRRLLESQRAAYAGAGVASESGTPLAVQAESAYNESLRIEEILRTGGYQARNATARSNSAMARANLSSYQGQQAYRAGVTGAASSLVSGVGNYYGTRSGYYYGGGSQVRKPTKIYR